MLLAWPVAAVAGPPYVTDDPEPTDTVHWEIYNFVQGNEAAGTTVGQAGLDLNYGGFEDVQLSATLPTYFALGAQSGSSVADIQLAAKYRFLHQSDGSLLPDAAVFPRVFLPTADHQFGTRHWNLLLPLWLEKDWGPWSLFGGGGLTVNPGGGQQNWWQSGLAVARALDDQLVLGAEIYHQTPAAIGQRPFTGANLGLTYNFVEHWSLLFAGGPGLQNAGDEGRYDFYLALEAQF